MTLEELRRARGKALVRREVERATLQYNIDGVKSNVVASLKSTRNMKPYESNWLLFASEIEAFLLETTGECDEKRLRYGIDAFMTRKGWYVGDGLYADGKDFAVDGYNSFVIQPMIWDVSNVLARHGMKDGLCHSPSRPHEGYHLPLAFQPSPWPVTVSPL